MKSIFKKTALVSALSILIGVVPLAHGDEKIPGLVKLTSGTHGCSGNHASRVGGTENQHTSWNFRNFNSSKSINIDTVRVYAASGTIIFDAPAIDALPTNFKAILGPHQSTQLRSWKIFSSALPKSQRPLQLVVDWSIADEQHGLPPRISIVRHARDAFTGEERSRHGGGGCSLLKYKK